ncbi:cytochrome P450 76C1-like [Camellia sinensis]|uniref:cytochrome P450 76C1-like n=1 Tax=Camellia sinensis TaxID=4442 RepID=UPI001035C570|nr:cytochrome P450 76C1-like [Camellia sinensis]
MESLTLQMCFHGLKPLDPQGLRCRGKVAYDLFYAVSDGFVTRRLKHRESNLPSYRDLMDSLLDYSQEHGSEFGYKHIIILLGELKLVQTELIEWAMTELLRHPDIMSKVREKVKKAVGEEGRIEEPKILALPYLHAVVKETMRLHLSLPFRIPHKSETDMKLCDFQIPKNTQILVNVWAIARNPAYWENPTQFMPEWFLGSNMEYRGQHFAFLPFGSGRRMCPGLPLAQRVVSLMLASLVYHLDWKLPDGLTPKNLGLIRSASPCRGQHLFLLF